MCCMTLYDVLSFDVMTQLYKIGLDRQKPVLVHLNRTDLKFFFWRYDAYTRKHDVFLSQIQSQNGVNSVSLVLATVLILCFFIRIRLQIIV